MCISHTPVEYDDEPYSLIIIAFYAKTCVNCVQVLRIIIVICRICNPEEFNRITGCVSMYPSVNANESSDRYLQNLLNKVFKESKSKFLLGDFNNDSLKFDHNTSAKEFLNSLV